MMAYGMGAYPSTDFATFMNAHDGTTSARYKETLASYATAASMGMVTLPISNCE